MVKLMTRKCVHVSGANILLLGLTFKENCPDIRNTRVIDIIRELESYGVAVQVNDPLADAAEAHEEYGVHLTPLADLAPAAAVVLAVSHEEYRRLGVAGMRRLLGAAPILVDVKGIFAPDEVRAAGISLWRL